MNHFSKIAFTLLSTFAVSSVFAQCQPGSPCYYQQQGGYQQGYQQDGYQQGYQRGYQQDGYQQGYQQGQYRGGYQQQNYPSTYYQSTAPQGSPQPNDSRRVGAKFYGERPTQNADGTMSYQGYQVYMDSSSQLAAQDPNASSTMPGQTDPNAPTSNTYSSSPYSSSTQSSSSTSNQGMMPGSQPSNR